MSDTSFGTVFSKRAAMCFFLIITLLFTGILRVAVTATSDYSSVLSAQNSLRLTVGNLRGTIYDRNLIPLTNSTTEVIAAVSPTPRAVTAVSSVLDGEELDAALQKLKGNKPVLIKLPYAIECDGVACTEAFVRNTPDMPAVHILGYTDSSSHGVSGIEKAYDSLLYSEKTLSFVYEKDGLGRMLYGIDPIIENDTSVAAGGVVSTIDVNIQTIAEKEANALQKGAVVVADAENGKIRAAVSRPDFDCSDISSYLSDENSPLLNRVFSAYNVGSVFKPCVAAAGIECGKTAFTHCCVGSVQIGNRFFNCHKRSGHGDMELISGIAESCNTFFYNYAFWVGGEKIHAMASKLCFGRELKLGDGLYTANGCQPNVTALSNRATLANYSIGQGELLLTPVSLLTLYCAIASGGTYNIPSIIEGTLANGSFTEYDIGEKTRVMSKKTAELLKKALIEVVNEGTGKAAKPMTVNAAGKTATAQTGKIENQYEVCEGWFCGFFPAEAPKYVVVVFSEDVTKQSVSCAEIFAHLADDISELEKH